MVRGDIEVSQTADGSSSDALALVDPELVPALAAIPDFGPLSDATLGSFRALMTAVAQEAEADEPVEVDEITLAGGTGHPEVSALLYRHRNTGLRPAILNVHGGGYVVGSALRDDPAMRLLAVDAEAVILSVDYRLAPETPYPGPLEDCYAALCWLHDNAMALGIDRNRIAVRGVSAGGGLAAGLALLARDRGGPAIAWQLLLYPMLDDSTGAHPVAGRFVWPASANRYGWDAYLGALAGGQEIPYTAVPARADDLSGLPPTFIATGAIDLFADEDVQFAQRLMQWGVPTELHVYPGAYHGFNLVESARIARQYAEDARRALRRALHPE